MCLSLSDIDIPLERQTYHNPRQNTKKTIRPFQPNPLPHGPWSVWSREMLADTKMLKKAIIYYNLAQVIVN